MKMCVSEISLFKTNNEVNGLKTKATVAGRWGFVMFLKNSAAA
jgi:hypothetical protein